MITLLLLINCMGIVLISSADDYCDRRFEKRLETLSVLNEQLDYLWNRLDEDIEEARNDIKNSRIKSNRLYYNYIVVNVMGNILRLAGRNLNDEGSYNIADVFDNIGRASYSIGFTTDEAYNIHPEVVPTCILSPITEKFQLRSQLDHYQKVIFRHSNQHPLLNLGQDFQPEVMKSYVDQFLFRTKVALSCLIEESQGQTLRSTLDMISNASNRKINLITNILQDKMSDIGGSAHNHWCLEKSAEL